MPIQESFNRAAVLAKWKVDQQTRIFKIQSQIHDLENIIRAKKAELAEKTLILFDQNQLVEEDLLAICNSIDESHRQIESKRFEEGKARKEQSPDIGLYSPKYPDAQTNMAEDTKSGLVCPECGRELVGKFCPVHGIEGVAKEQPSEAETLGPASSSTDQLYCPQCHQLLRSKFCPKHGLEGVPNRYLGS
jgi:predicted RNA-binding Zn-ribbon protein involved in translation (DUF1610 family)